MSKERNNFNSVESPIQSEYQQEKTDNVNVELVEDKNSAEGLATSYNDLECSIYQNYTASEVFVQGLAGIVNQQDVEAMIRAQKKM